MSKYSVKSTKQEPFKSGIRTPKFLLEAIIEPKTNKIVSFALTIKEKVKSFPVLKGDINKTFKEVKEYITLKALKP
jgi:hypothetical protein